MYYKPEEFFIKDIKNNISLSRNEFLLQLNKLIFFLKKKKIDDCDVYILDVKKYSFLLIFFCLTFLWKKIILNTEINKKIKLDFAKICNLKKIQL